MINIRLVIAMLNKVESKYSYHILNTVKILQNKFGNREIQSKCIINELEPKISSQTVYKTMQILIRDGYLIKHEKGKFAFYNMTNKGIELLDELIESHNRNVARPIIDYMINAIRKKYPKEFKDVSDRDLDNYLYEMINEFKNSIVKNVIKNFT